MSPNAFFINLSFYCASIIFQKMTRSYNVIICGCDIIKCVDVFICIAFITYRLILLALAMKWTQGNYYFYGYIASLNLGITILVLNWCDLFYSSILHMHSHFKSVAKNDLVVSHIFVKKKIVRLID